MSGARCPLCLLRGLDGMLSFVRVLDDGSGIYRCSNQKCNYPSHMTRLEADGFLTSGAPSDLPPKYYEDMRVVTSLTNTSGRPEASSSAQAVPHGDNVVAQVAAIHPSQNALDHASSAPTDGTATCEGGRTLEVTGDGLIASTSSNPNTPQKIDMKNGMETNSQAPRNVSADRVIASHASTPPFADSPMRSTRDGAVPSAVDCLLKMAAPTSILSPLKSNGIGDADVSKPSKLADRSSTDARPTETSTKHKNNNSSKDSPVRLDGSSPHETPEIRPNKEEFMSSDSEDDDDAEAALLAAISSDSNAQQQPQSPLSSEQAKSPDPTDQSTKTHDEPRMAIAAALELYKNDKNSDSELVACNSTQKVGKTNESDKPLISHEPGRVDFVTHSPFEVNSERDHTESPSFILFSDSAKLASIAIDFDINELDLGLDGRSTPAKKLRQAKKNQEKRKYVTSCYSLRQETPQGDTTSLTATPPVPQQFYKPTETSIEPVATTRLLEDALPSRPVEKSNKRKNSPPPGPIIKFAKPVLDQQDPVDSIAETNIDGSSQPKQTDVVSKDVKILPPTAQDHLIELATNVHPASWRGAPQLDRVSIVRAPSRYKNNASNATTSTAPIQSILSPCRRSTTIMPPPIAYIRPSKSAAQLERQRAQCDDTARSWSMLTNPVQNKSILLKATRQTTSKRYPSYEEDRKRLKQQEQATSTNGTTPSANANLQTETCLRPTFGEGAAASDPIALEVDELVNRKLMEHRKSGIVPPMPASCGLVPPGMTSTPSNRLVPSHEYRPSYSSPHEHNNLPEQNATVSVPPCPAISAPSTSGSGFSPSRLYVPAEYAFTPPPPGLPQYYGMYSQVSPAVSTPQSSPYAPNDVNLNDDYDLFDL